MKNQKLISRNAIRKFLPGGLARHRNYDLDIDSIFSQLIADTVRIVADTLRQLSSQLHNLLKNLLGRTRTNLLRHNKVQFKNFVDPTRLVNNRPKYLYTDNKPEYYYLHADTVAPQDTVLIQRSIVVQPDTTQVLDSIPVQVLDSVLRRPFPTPDLLIGQRRRQNVLRLFRPLIRLGRSSENRLNIDLLENLYRAYSTPLPGMPLVAPPEKITIKSGKEYERLLPLSVYNFFKNPIDNFFSIFGLSQDKLNKGTTYTLVDGKYIPGDIDTGDKYLLIRPLINNQPQQNNQQNNQQLLPRQNNQQPRLNNNQSRLSKSGFSGLGKLVNMVVLEAKKQKRSSSSTPVILEPNQFIIKEKASESKFTRKDMEDELIFMNLLTKDEANNKSDEEIANLFLNYINKNVAILDKEPSKQEEKKKETPSTSPFAETTPTSVDLNRADVRAIMSHYGLDTTPSLRKAFRKYLGGDKNQDISFIDLNSNLHKDWIAPFVIYKKTGGRLISKNIINRFKYGK